MLAAFFVALILALSGSLAVRAQQAAGQTQPPAGQPQPADQTQLTFRSGINFVTVDAYVADSKGQPVTDLKQSDFEIIEDNKPQKIEQFRFIKVDGNPKPGEPPPQQIKNRDDEEREAARDDTRVFVIFLDDYHTRLGSSLAVRQPLSDWVQNNLRPLDMVAIMYPLTPVSDIDFTRDHNKIINAVQHFEGRKYKYEPRNLFEEQYQRAPTEVVEQIRNQVVMTALRGLSTRLGSIREGRKSIIYVSEGLQAMLPPQLRSADASQPNLGNPNAFNPFAGENDPREQTAQAFSTADLYSQLKDVFIAATRNNTAIYTLDPRGLATNEFDIDENVGPQQDRNMLQASTDTLRSIAEETDGRAIVGRNDLAKGLAQALQDSTAYYLLGYTSSQAPVDGKFHQIKVQLSAAAKKRGLQIRARRGYWAATTEDVKKAEKATGPAVPDSAKPVMQALASIAVPVQAGKFVRTWLGTERGQNGKTKVTLVWEPLPKTTGVSNLRSDPAPGRVSVIAATEKGDLVYRGRSPDAGQLASANPQATGASASLPAAASAATTAAPQALTFEAPPGKLELRMTVEGAGGGVLDQEIRNITIPDLTAARPAISTPRVYAMRTPREFQAVASNAAAVPPANREFSRTMRLLIRFDSYGPGNEVPTPTAALLNSNGQKFTDVPVQPATAGGTHQIDMSLATIPAGEYVIEITTKGASGETAKELVAFRVTP
ncbi:MAG TPA: VWA domain-containing protein [Vicinamibacterales bacterium]|nr:VWA domain-containing protein [Vicinamibacterales bacterium]